MPSADRVEVVVVGAGPAGLRASIAAAERGVSVLVFEKKSSIGTPVRCGEFFPSQKEIVNLLPGTRSLAHLFEIPASVINNHCDAIRLYSPLGKCWEFPFDACVIDRVRFERALAKEAEELGVEFKLGRPARIFGEESEVRVGPSMAESREAGVIIVADGFPSMTASSLGLTDARYTFGDNVATNYQYLMDDLNLEPNVTEMYTGTSVAPGGYGWIIPKSGSAANVGVGIRTSFLRSRRGKDHLDYFVKLFPLTASKLGAGHIREMIADPLPVDGAVSITYSSRALSVGDAAGMVMATNGGGIPTALVAGHIAGEVAALHVQEGEPLSSYESRWKKAIGMQLLASARMRRFADFFMHHDGLFDLATKALGVGGVKKVVTCEVPSAVGVLMRLCGY